MALPSTGAISFSQINGAFSRTATPISLTAASTGSYGAINQSSANKPNGSAPHAISEFRGYTNAIEFRPFSVKSGDKSCNGGGQMIIRLAQARTVWCAKEGNTLDYGDTLYSDPDGLHLITYTFLQGPNNNSNYYDVVNGNITEIYLYGSPC